MNLIEENFSKFPYKEFPRVLPQRSDEGFLGGAWPDNTGQN